MVSDTDKDIQMIGRPLGCDQHSAASADSMLVNDMVTALREFLAAREKLLALLARYDTGER